MMNVESLKDYIDIKGETELTRLVKEIYGIINIACNSYPNYREWFFNKQLPKTINSNERNILFVRNKENKIISIACLKKSDDEKKICTLYVEEQYRQLGIATKIVEESMKWLGTSKPLITITDYKLEMFKSIINKYGWKLIEIVPGIYNEKFNELCFNGTLTKTIDFNKTI